nr:MAG TPA: hypothetical protein [Bacteriophage sp.]
MKAGCRRLSRLSTFRHKYYGLYYTDFGYKCQVLFVIIYIL